MQTLHTAVPSAHFNNGPRDDENRDDKGKIGHYGVVHEKLSFC